MSEKFLINLAIFLIVQNFLKFYLFFKRNQENLKGDNKILENSQKFKKIYENLRNLKNSPNLLEMFATFRKFPEFYKKMKNFQS